MKKHSLAVGLFASLLLNVFFALRPVPKAREVATPPAAAVVEPSPSVPEEVDVPAPTPPALPPVFIPRPTPRAALPVVSLIALPAYAAPGAEMIVTCTVHSGGVSTRDWIGLYPVGAGVNGYKAHVMAVEGSGAYAFKAPAVPGAYEFRYMLDDDRTSVATSAAVTVIGTPPTPPLVSLQSLATTVRRGEEIATRVALHSGQGSDRDWIGVFAPEATNEQYLTWVYVAPGAKLKAPDQPGVYEIRYLLDNGYESVAVSTRILVTD